MVLHEPKEDVGMGCNCGCEDRVHQIEEKAESRDEEFCGCGCPCCGEELLQVETIQPPTEAGPSLIDLSSQKLAKAK